MPCTALKAEVVRLFGMAEGRQCLRQLYHAQYARQLWRRYCGHAAARQLHPPSLHDALPISTLLALPDRMCWASAISWSVGSTWVNSLTARMPRAEEHTSELQSRVEIVCRVLL